MDFDILALRRARSPGIRLRSSSGANEDRVLASCNFCTNSVLNRPDGRVLVTHFGKVAMRKNLSFCGSILAGVLLWSGLPARGQELPFTLDESAGTSDATQRDKPLALSESAAWADAPVTSAPQSQPVLQPESQRLRSWELPPVTVVGEKPAELREDQRVGSYGQPRWTATRRFPNTRVYVIPEHTYAVEYWLRSTFDRNGVTEFRHLYEFEIGLPYRFQLDLYYRGDQTTDSKYLNGAQIEMRWALADWGKIPLNPTIYLEYAPLEDRPDKVEGRLLLGDDLAPGWHWGVNLNGEFETGGNREYEYQVSGGISYTLIDMKLDVGAEGKILLTDQHDHRGDFVDQYLVGPSIQWRPVPNMSVNLAPLVGIGVNSPYVEATLNVGWEF